MINFLKKNKASVVVGFFTFVLGAIAIATAVKLYELRTTLPTDSGASQQSQVTACSEITIVVNSTSSSPSPTGSATATPTSTPTGTSSPTATPTDSGSATATPTPTTTPSGTGSSTATPVSYSCDTPCTTDSQCRTANSNYICYSATNTCRHINYPQENDCSAPPTSTGSGTDSNNTSTPTTSGSGSSTNTNSGTGSSSGGTGTGGDTIGNETNELPDAGISLPTVLSVGTAGLILVAALILAL